MKLNPFAHSRGPLFTTDDKRAIVWFFFGYLWPKAKWLGVIVLLVTLQGLVYRQFLYLTENGLRVIFEKGSFTQLYAVCAAVFGLFMFRAVTSYITPRLSAWVAGDAIYKMRKDLISKLLSFDLSYYERTPPGEIILRLVQQPDGLGQFVGQGTVNALRDTLTVIIIAAYLISQQPWLFLFALGTAPAILLAIAMISDRIKKIQREAENVIGAYMSGIEEVANGMRTVKIAGQEPAEQTRLVTASEGIKWLLIRIQSVQALMMPTVDVAAAFAYMLVIGAGGYLVISPDHDLDGAGLVTFLLGLVLLFDPARRAAHFFVTLQAQLVILRMIHGLFELEPRIKDAPDAVAVDDPKAAIRFENVSFGYTHDQPLFEDLTLTLQGGHTTAIVGSTGSGKTTILSLLARLYDVEGGRILYGDTDIRDLKLSELRHQFSVVAQDIVVFNKSIWENIHYIRPDATEDEVWAAAEAAEIADLIRARKGEPVGPKGAQLSGGQKQRIAIARAFLRAAPVVILDEATSALDQKTEARVMRALDRLAAGRTTIMVSHRMSSVMGADRIYVLESGKLVEDGTHEELMARGQLYATMFEAQRSGYD
ncbi:MAG: ABC transporter ATP-binding protein/permease [Rhodobacteraceae bacterium]|nr:ABC transporter ATP-binding protein/permease [Paracoccaceae bacterium]